MLEVRHFSPAVFEAHRQAGDALFNDRLASADALFKRLGVTGISNNWHLQSAWKRSLGTFVYADLLEGKSNRRVLEIGGGLSGITMALANANDFRLVELATHEGEQDYRKIEQHLGRSFVTVGDWHTLPPPEPQDVVIANDLFPNVDQRLEWFLDKYLPITKEMRLTLTYYENTAWQVRRISSGETLTVKPWGLREVTRVLDSVARDYGPYDRSQLVYECYEGTLFTNRRNILFVRIIRSV